MNQKFEDLFSDDADRQPAQDNKDRLSQDETASADGRASGSSERSGNAEESRGRQSLPGSNQPQEDDDLDESDVFENSLFIAQPPKPPKSRKDMRRKRSRVKQRRLISIILAISIVVVIVVAAVFVTMKVRNLAPQIENSRQYAADYPGPGRVVVDFTVNDGDSAEKVAAGLVKAGIIKSQAAFTQAVAAKGAESTLYPGTFTLRLRMKAADVLTILTDQTKAGGFLEIKAGDKASDTFKKASNMSGLPLSDFTALVNDKGAGILPAEANGSFEGWLEPGSYNVKNAGSAKDIVTNLVNKRISHLDELGVPTGSQRENILEVASIAEAEVNQEQYYGKVSRVIDNRLAQDMPLGMDSTIAYGKGVSASELTNAMLQDASNPYNSRIHKGLPPTPISIPGDSAIKAALNPEAGDWLYFVTVNLDTGETKFTNDAAQFQQYVSEYKDWEAKNG
ncbi:endolytic transglycosylase MltG [Bifidobacterium aquikefiricola]|uniref:Endolytic murein transglycosylase n=1 Tax=Bifidobacterium aquikefiricola TaxID=3059038 RepID=A0AB39U8V6_9BIFI